MQTNVEAQFPDWAHLCLWRKTKQNTCCLLSRFVLMKRQHWAWTKRTREQMREGEFSPTHWALQHLKLIATTHLTSLFSTFDNQVLSGAALHTDGCCYGAENCGIVIRHQSDSAENWRYVFVFYVTLNKSFSISESVHLLPTSQTDLATGWTPRPAAPPPALIDRFFRSFFFSLLPPTRCHFLLLSPVVHFASSLDRLYIYRFLPTPPVPWP